MLKLTYKEVKDFAILPSIEGMKDVVLPFRFNYWLLKIYRKMKKEMDAVDQQLRDVLLAFIEKDAEGKPVPQEEEKDADGKVVTARREWKYIPGGEEAHRKAFKQKAEESLKIEFKFPDVDPISLEQLEKVEISLAALAGLEPLSVEYQAERDAEAISSAG